MLTVLVCTRRPAFWRNVVENLDRQVRQPDLVVVVYQGFDGDLPCKDLIPNVPRIILHKAEPDWNLPQKRLKGMEIITAETQVGSVSHFDDDDRYSEHYLEEVAAAFVLHPDAAIVGKAQYYTRWTHKPITPILDGCHLSEIAPNGRVPWVAGPSISINIAKWIQHPTFRYNVDDIFDDRALLQSVRALDLPIYTTSRDNFFYQRYPEGHNHLWAAPNPKL